MYIEVIILINFFFDYILLYAVNKLLRRSKNIKSILLGALVGSLTAFLVYFDISNIKLFLIKILFSVLMVCTTFKIGTFKYLCNNLFYLYVTSIFLGGFLYFINVQLAYNITIDIITNNPLSLNIYMIIIISPIIIYYYVKKQSDVVIKYTNYYEMNLFLKDGRIIDITGFLDSGNRLYDPITKKPIILINKNVLNINYEDYKMFYTQYETIDNRSLIKCILIDKIMINGIGMKEDVIVGISKNKIKIEGIDCILHTDLLGC